DAAKRARANGPPLWALLAIAFFGFDEFLSVLYNPFYLVIVVFMAFVVKSVYTKLDVAAEMQMGLVPGLLAIYPKVLPALLSYLKDVAEKAQEIAEEQQKKHEEHVAKNPQQPPPSMVAQMPAYNMTELSPAASISPVTEEQSATSANISENGLRRRGAGEE
ncbi:Cell wall protein rhd3, partial [Cymbomonas tetramitiformis]